MINPLDIDCGELIYRFEYIFSGFRYSSNTTDRDSLACGQSKTFELQEILIRLFHKLFSDCFKPNKSSISQENNRQINEND